MSEKRRWRVAYAMNRLKGQCWADLVSWVLRSDLDYRTRLPWRPVRDCDTDAERSGTCYCGKRSRLACATCTKQWPGCGHDSPVEWVVEDMGGWQAAVNTSAEGETT